MTAKTSAWLSADEAIRLLDVSRATLYAYVSRGRIRSEAVVGDTRRRRYSRDDVERLAARTREVRNPAVAAEQALHWGVPVLESRITLIADGALYYRGQDAARLARNASLAQVAALLWGVDAATLAAPSALTSAARRGTAVPFMAAAQGALAAAGAKDPHACDLRPHAVARTGWRIAWQLAHVAARGSPAETLDATLARGWGVPRVAPILRAALILCADHELNVSTFAARCVASAGASPYGAVIAGLAALEGAKHGGTTARIEASWDALRRERDLESALADRLRRDEHVDGFGHPLYPAGDPRAAALLDLLPKRAERAFAQSLADAARAVLGEAPTIDFALVAAARVLGLPRGAPLTLFAIGRTLGWICHVIEQYEKNAIIRPRARYVGEPPMPTPA